MRPFLQEMFSRVRGKAPFITTRRRAAGKDDKATEKVHSPSLTIFGVSTPEQFYAALTHGNVADGFMNRFLLAPAAKRVAIPNNNIEMIPVPQIITDTIAGVIPDVDGDLGILGVFSMLVKVPEYKLEWAGQEVADAALAFELAIL